MGAKQLMLYFIEVFDLFLLGTVRLIMGLSLRELFMDSDLKLTRAPGRSRPSRTSRAAMHGLGHGGHRVSWR